ncbi:MAG: hypothetical protein K9J16_10925 [Melioribacteraceae bacterium]|nr:hypothetical protein [Melioribacteraceae bacterium]MCF8394209.1 hypothetical protein [Melioribacteraceae bacterium]MCF8419929.1 hypothetical protein [Melioribacteraceae bacterium]
MRIYKIVFLVSLYLFIHDTVFSQYRLIKTNTANNKLHVTIEIESENFLFNRLESLSQRIKENDSSIPTFENPFFLDLFINLPENVDGSKITTLQRESKQIDIALGDYLSQQVLNSSNLFDSKSRKIEFRGNFKFKQFIMSHIRIYPLSFNSNGVGINSIIELIVPLPPTSSQSTIIYKQRNGMLITDELKIQRAKAAETTFDWIDFNSDYLIIKTNSDNIYRITKSDLEEYGISSITINPNELQLFLRGEEIPIFVYGAEDNSFDDGDYIEFASMRNYGGKHREVGEFGQPYNEYLGRYTDTTTYFLTWGIAAGLRVEERSYDSSILESLDFYHEVLHYEVNNWFDFSMADIVRRESPYWLENKTWNEGNINVGIRNRNFTLSDVYPDETVYLFAKLQDYASNISTNAHALGLSINSTSIYDTTIIDKYEKVVLQASYNSNELLEGNNTFKLHSFATEAVLNACIGDWYEIEYPRYLKTYNDTLLFKFPYVAVPTDYKVSITNTGSSDYVIWQYKNGYKKFITHRQDESIYFTDNIQSENKYIIKSAEKIRKPEFAFYGKIENLGGSNLQADYLLITHPNFILQANEYAEFIETSYSVSAKVINVNDIYNQFSYGFFNPESIKDFLKITHQNWELPHPENVFLVGGGTYDYHLNKHIHQGYPIVKNYVPSFGASVSDNWFTVWDTTGAFIPQMNIGRIPVTTTVEFDWYFQKHQQYVSQEFTSWNKTFLFFSGGTGDDQSQLDQLRGVNEFIINNYTAVPPIAGKVNHFYKTIDPTTNFGPFTDEEVESAIDEGALFISYIGHSGTRTWDNSITEPYQLENEVNRFPLVTDFGCSTGRFAEPDVTSFAELFTLSGDGQAISYVGNSSLGFLSTATTVPRIFYRKILADSIYNISEALNSAKLELIQNYGNTGVNQLFGLTNTYFGDPILNIALPDKPNLEISSTGIAFSTQTPSDNLDSLGIQIVFNNFGIVSTDSFKVSCKHIYEGIEDSTYIFNKTVPWLSDTISLSIPIKSKAGEHSLEVVLDSENQVDEIYEDDNNIVVNFEVSSSSYRPLLGYETESTLNNQINILNPTAVASSTTLQLEISDKPEFLTSTLLEKSISNIQTQFGLESFDYDRYWFRLKGNNQEVYSSSYTFYKSSDGIAYLISDSLSMGKSTFLNLRNNGNQIELANDSINFSALSAGFNDGRTVLILKNGDNFIPENTLRGHHICLFDTSNYKFVKHKHFDLLGGGSTAAQEYIQFLDTLTSKFITIIAINDEGRVTNAELRNQIKSIGSQYIDNVGFRYSWAIIGQKGAPIGSVPEAYTVPTFGSVTIDTTIVKQFNNGTLLTSLIGPSRGWKNIFIEDSVYSNTSLTYFPVVYDNNMMPDTLSPISSTTNLFDITGIDYKQYPKMRLLAEFNKSVNSTSPKLFSLGVEYDETAELATNYQVAAVTSDSVFQGDSVSFNFAVYNVGGSTADSFNVLLNLIKSDNTKNKLFDTLVTDLSLNSRKEFLYNYQSNYYDGYGNMAFEISIDTSNRVTEFYEDNNYFKQPFYVIQDTITNIKSAEIDVTFDGMKIYNGDFVSDKPEIKILLQYQPEFPFSDTNAVQFFLDSKPLYYTVMDTIGYDTIKRQVTYSLSPSLSDGEHLLRIEGKNLFGNLQSLSGYEVSFQVSSEAKLLYVYNFPNPFGDQTFFTFKLTKIPDELKLRIYTVAGRLIKEFLIPPSELNIDLNKVFWDGRDEDGDLVANGVYIYKLIAESEGKTISQTQKLAVVR